jgi:hypothetical protein
MRVIPFILLLSFLWGLKIKAQDHIAQYYHKPKDIALNQKFPFYQSKKKSKIKWLKSGAKLRIYLKDSILPYSCNNSTGYSNCINARLYSKNDSTLFIYAYHTNGNYRYKLNGGHVVQSLNFSFPFDSIIRIKSSDIENLYYDKPERLARIVFGCGFPLAIIAIVIVAPATSINLSKGTVNSSLYQDILYPSFGILVADIFAFGYEFGNHSSIQLMPTQDINR